MISSRRSKDWNKPFHFSKIQRDLLTTLHAEGMTGAHLDAWIPSTDKEDTEAVTVGDETRIFDRRFTEMHSDALISLVRNHRLKPLKAIEEINSLSVAELNLLKDFYKKGLRGDHLRASRLIGTTCRLYHVCCSKQQFNHKYKDALDYFCEVMAYLSKQGVDIVSALLVAGTELNAVYDNVANEIAGDITGIIHTESKRLKFLRQHISHGIKACDTDKVMTEEQMKAFYVLKLMHHLTPLEAIRQVRGLSDDTVVFLRQHYGADVNHQTLSVFPHHAEFIKYRMRKHNMSAAQAMADLQKLSPNQLVYYHMLEEIGVTYEMVLQLPKNVPYSQNRVDIAITLVREKKFEPCQALKEVVENNDEELQKILHEGRIFRSQLIF